MRHVCGFFFYKHKTAYGMRISDWSSDVFSSDLLLEQGIGGQDAESDAIERFGVHRTRARGYDERLRLDALVASFQGAWRDKAPIGRASCRESGGQSCRSRW